MIRYLVRQGILAALQKGKSLYYERQQYVTIVIKPKRLSSETYDVKQNYYFTTKEGLCALMGGYLYQLTQTQSYGLAFSGNDVYLSIDLSHYSCVVRFPRHYLSGQFTGKVRAEIVYGRYVHNLRGRIHQVTAINNGPVWVANTSRNSVVKIESGKEPVEYTPFLDRFGAPMLYDQNHINSVVDYGDFQLFSAFNAGTGSMLGLIRDNVVTGFWYKNRAIHDIYLTQSGFILCDMLGDEQTCGGLVTQNGFDNQQIHTLVQHHSIRGLSVCGDEMLVGLSVKKEKGNERMQGQAKIAVLRDGTLSCVVTILSSQIYQIVHESGEIITPAARPRYDDVYAAIEKIMGVPTYKEKLIMIASEEQTASNNLGVSFVL